MHPCYDLLQDLLTLSKCYPSTNTLQEDKHTYIATWYSNRKTHTYELTLSCPAALERSQVH